MTDDVGFDNVGRCFPSDKDLLAGWPPIDVPLVIAQQPPVLQPPNPKTLMGRLKLPILTVVPPASIIGEAEAMRYGAFEAPRADGTKGYGPFNWRDQPIEAMVYVDASMRHLMAWVDGEECAQDSLVHHLKHAKATIGILLDAIELKNVIDNRPRVPGTAAAMLERSKRK